MGANIQEMRHNGTEVMWHEKVTWRHKRGYGGRRSGDNNNTCGGDMGDRCLGTRGGGGKGDVIGGEMGECRIGVGKRAGR
jgi:hypothetical protein